MEGSITDGSCRKVFEGCVGAQVKLLQHVVNEASFVAIVQEVHDNRFLLYFSLLS